MNQNNRLTFWWNSTSASQGGRPTARRAYFLHANADLALLQAPQFVEPAQATANLKPVPFFERGVSEEAWPTKGYFAVECYYRDG